MTLAKQLACMERRLEVVERDLADLSSAFHLLARRWSEERKGKKANYLLNAFIAGHHARGRTDKEIVLYLEKVTGKSWSVEAIKKRRKRL